MPPKHADVMMILVPDHIQGDLYKATSSRT